MGWSTKKAIRRIFYGLFGLVVLVVVIPLAILVLVCASVYSELPDIEPLINYRLRIPMQGDTTDGFLIKEIGEERRVFIKIENVPTTLKQALLAVEDERFYEHIGVDLTGILRTHLTSLRSERSRQGTSTITMQVARNFYLNPARGNRHLGELLLAVKIERSLSKDQILEIYINQIYLGQHAYGFEAAAQTYFGKPLGELSLAETALLAGLPKGPSTMNPIVNPGRAKLRRDYVLGRMRELGYIDEAAYQAAMEEPLQTVSKNATRNPVALSPIHPEAVAIANSQPTAGK